MGLDLLPASLIAHARSTIEQARFFCFGKYLVCVWSYRIFRHTL